MIQSVIFNYRSNLNMSKQHRKSFKGKKEKNCSRHYSQSNRGSGTKMAFDFKKSKLSAVCQTVLGSLCLIFGILDRSFAFARYSDVVFHTKGALAIWMGVWFLVTGVIGYFASKRRIQSNQGPKIAMINTYLGFSIVATVFAGVLLICYSVGVTYILRGRPCSENMTYKYYCFYKHSKYYPYKSHSCSSRIVSLETQCQRSVGLGAMIIIFAVVEFGVSIWASICCCSACTNGCCDGCCGYTTTPQGQVVYLQTQEGPVAAYVMTQGPNGMPVAVPAMTGGPVHTVPNQAVGGQAYIMQNPQGATSLRPTQYVQGADGQVYMQNPQGASSGIPSQQDAANSRDQQTVMKNKDASSEPPPVYTP